MTNREIIDTYVICGKLKSDLIDDKYNVDGILDSDISIKSTIDLCIACKNALKNTFMQLLLINDMIFYTFKDDKEFCSKCINHINEIYMLCIKHIGKFNLSLNLNLANLYSVILSEAPYIREHRDKNRFMNMIDCMVKFQRIGIDSGIIIDKKRYTIIEYRAVYENQRVFRLSGYKNETINLIVIDNKSEMKFLKEMDKYTRTSKIQDMLRDPNIKLIMALQSVHDNWVKSDYRR